MRNGMVRTMGQSVSLLIVCLFVLVVPGWAKTITKGSYTDSAGQVHTWNINEGHTLIWEGKPFVPVGGRFQARSWVPTPTEADFQADIATLTRLKKCGVMDVYLQPARGGLTEVPAAAIQRILDHLEAEGFIYGISINDFPQDILSGYEVRPGKYRQVMPEEGGLLRYPVENLASARYFMVTEASGDIIQDGNATTVAEGARVVAPPVPTRSIVFLIPQRVYLNVATLGFPNVWEGFDGYRDTLIALFRKVKLGKGFRFFVDPLSDDLRLTDEAEAVIPTSAAFTAEWSEWLTRRYRNVENLMNAWSINDREIKDFSDAATLMPLWGGGKGVEYFFHPASERKYRVNTRMSAFWKDMSTFKADSLRSYMNDLAAVLKKTVADVPVVYRSNGFSELFTRLPAERGFDGIGMEAYGRGAELVTQSGGYVYAQAVEASKTVWLPVIATGDALPGKKIAPGYASRPTLHADFDWLREIGARGFYVDGVQVVDSTRKLYDLSENEEQLTWVADYSRMLEASGVRFNAPAPRAIFYPRGLALASVKPLSDGGWWLPTNRPHFPYDFGASGQAYALAEPDGKTVYYLWHPTEKRKIRLKIPKAARVNNAPPLEWSRAAEGSIKGDILTLTIGPDPVRLVNYPSVPVPMDAFDESLQEGKRYQALMVKQGMMEGRRYQMQLDGAKQRYNTDDPFASLLELQRVLFEMRNKLRPYAWIEAERAVSHNFDEMTEKIGAASGAILSAAQRPTGSPPATAGYTIEINTAGAYNVWVAASPDAVLTLRLNSRPLLDEATLPIPVGKLYADNQLVWFRLGVATLPKGIHTLEVRAETAARLDVILLTRDAFQPDGPNPPPLKL